MSKIILFKTVKKENAQFFYQEGFSLILSVNEKNVILWIKLLFNYVINEANFLHLEPKGTLLNGSQ